MNCEPKGRVTTVGNVILDICRSNRTYLWNSIEENHLQVSESFFLSYNDNFYYLNFGD